MTAGTELRPIENLTARESDLSGFEFRNLGKGNCGVIETGSAEAFKRNGVLGNGKAIALIGIDDIVGRVSEL